MRAVRFGSFLALLVVVLISVLTFAQTATVTDESGAVIKIHRFQPVMPAESAEAVASAASAKRGELSDYVVKQINALEDDKEARTPAQLKINPQLIYTARMLQGQQAAPGIAALHTNMELDEQNNLLVDLKAVVSDELLERLRSVGARIVSFNSPYQRVRVLIPFSQLETVAAYTDIRFISPRSEAATVESAGSSGDLFTRWGSRSPGFAQRAARVREQLAAQLKSKGYGVACTGQGSVTSEGYQTHQVNSECASFPSVNGTGVTIGVLSDGASSFALSQTTGDLPPTCPAGPPCLTILPGQVGSGDEGTAMLEIVHDLAPGANLYFASAFNGIDSFAQNILDLRAAGCDIIVDDVIYFVESPFQDGQLPGGAVNDGGVVIQAVNDVVADGAMYFSSAGNDGAKDTGFPQTYEGDFVDGGASGSPLPTGKHVHKFGTNSYDVMDSFGGPVFLHWSDPLGGSTNDYDLFVLSATGSSVITASTIIQSSANPNDPVEAVGPNQQTGGLPNLRLVVLKANAAANRFLHITAFGSLLSVGTQGAIVGHAGATGAFAVGATPADLPICSNPVNCPTGPFPNPFNSTNKVEPFSSDGPRHIFFHGDGTAITPGNFSNTGGAVLQKPEITAADGVSVTGTNGTFPSTFYGTSAAAPHAGAIAALVKSSDLTLTNTEVGNFMTSSAVDIMGTGTDRDSGAGIVMALAAVQASLVPKITTLSPTSGNAGIPITVTGKHFGSPQGSSTITLNGTAVSVTTWADTSIAGTVPSGTTTGDVIVTVNGVASNSTRFTFTPAISGLSTSKAPAGTSITITGTNFGSTQDTAVVTINGATATVTSRTSTSIAANVPAGASTSGNVVVTINTVASNGTPFTVEDFANPASLGDITVKAGASGSDPFTITTATGFDATITFSCTGLPSKSTCSFSPASVPSMATSADVTMTVSTTASVTNGVSSGLFGMWVPFAGLGLVFAAGAGARKRNRKALAVVGAIVLLPLLAAIVSCGGGGTTHTTTPGTPPGSYTVTMKATATGGTTHSTTFKLNVN